MSHEWYSAPIGGKWRLRRTLVRSALKNLWFALTVEIRTVELSDFDRKDTSWSGTPEPKKRKKKTK
jgi:hypothetical protein